MVSGNGEGRGGAGLMRDGRSVALGLARWRAAFVIAFALLCVAKLMVAATLSPFGDEAFYWQESRHLAWGYSDLPPLTAWLIHLGESLAGHSVLGMRWPFLLIGSALPWLVRSFAREAFDERTGWQAALLCLALPLAGSLGVLALPEVPLTVATMSALVAWMRALDRGRLLDWLWLGLSLAVCWLTHYRAGMPMLAGILFGLLTRRGRMQWRQPGLWLALGVAALGLIPLLISNWQQQGAGVMFQLVERNPWRFHADALVQPLEQAAACTPLLYALLLWAAWESWRRRGLGGPWDVIAVVSGCFIAVYFLAGLFADDLRFRAHWPLPGYLPVLAAVPALLRERMPCRRVWLVVAFALAGVGQLAGLTYLGLAASDRGASVLDGLKAFPSRFVGWRESGALARELLATHPGVLVAGDFMLAAELDFQLDGSVPVYVLDNRLNVKHGRAPQLAIWQRNEAALRRAYGDQPMVLVVDETAVQARIRPPWLQSLCGSIDGPSPLQRLDLFDGRRRIAFYAGSVPAMSSTAVGGDARCVIWLSAAAAESGR